MTNDEALAKIHTALERALDKKVAVTPETDFFAEKILDSLDFMTFLLNIEELSGVKFPDKDPAAAGFNKVSKVMEHLTAG
jgi:acyl carrier protein